MAAFTLALHRQVAPLPSYLDQLPLANDAWAYAEEAHRGQTRKFDGQPFVAHPQEVAALLHDACCPDHVIAAGLLHDIVERTPVTVEDLAQRFGPRVAGLVEAVSEDAAIESYRERKEELRRRAMERGREAALLFAADKVSKVRHYHAQLMHPGSERPRTRRLREYTECLRRLERVIPDEALVGLLRHELVRVAQTLEAPVG
jgi:(p)ppGpp synthase/HD superfamily hydrolase